jgi:hypothetical protein
MSIEEIIQAVLERFHGEHQAHDAKLDKILANQETIMAGQASIDAAVAAIQATQANEAAAATQLGTDVTAIKGLLTAGGTPLNTTALDAAVAAAPASDSTLTTAVAGVTALASPVPPPAGAPAAEHF